MADHPQGEGLKQSSTLKKTTGARDAKSLKANKNRSLEAPAMPDLAKEKEVGKLATRQHGTAGRPYSQRIRDKVIELAGRGMTLTDIQAIPGMPRACTIGLWKKEDPDFAEEMEEAFSAFVDEVTKSAVPKLQQAMELRGFSDAILAESEQLPKLKANWKRDGLNKKLMINLLHAEKKGRTLASTAGVILSYAERRSALWRRDSEAISNMVVIDMSLEMDKKTDLPGSPTGQNAAALKAMRNVTP